MSDPLSGYEQTIWPTPDVDSMRFGSYPYTFPETMLYNSSLDLNSENLSYVGSYTTGEYTNARTMTTDLQLQPSNGQGLNLDPRFDFLSDYPGIDLDQMDGWYKDLGSSNNQLLGGDIIDTENSSVWTNDSSNQDFRFLGNQFENNFAAPVDGSPYSQVQSLILPRS